MSVVIFCSQLAGLCSGCSGAHWPAGASSGYTDDWAAACALDAAHCDDTTDNNIILVWQTLQSLLLLQRYFSLILMRGVEVV